MQDADSCPRCPSETRRREMALTAQDSKRAKMKGGGSLARLLVLSSLALRQHCSAMCVHSAASARSLRAQFLSQHPNRVASHALPPGNYPSGALSRPGPPPSAPCLRRPDTQHPWQDVVKTSSCVVARGGLHLEVTHRQRRPLVSKRDGGRVLALAHENGDRLRENGDMLLLFSILRSSGATGGQHHRTGNAPEASCRSYALGPAAQHGTCTLLSAAQTQASCLGDGRSGGACSRTAGCSKATAMRHVPRGSAACHATSGQQSREPRDRASSRRPQRVRLS